MSMLAMKKRQKKAVKSDCLGLSVLENREWLNIGDSSKKKYRGQRETEENRVKEAKGSAARKLHLFFTVL